MAKGNSYMIRLHRAASFVYLRFAYDGVCSGGLLYPANKTHLKYEVCDLEAGILSRPRVV